MSFVHDDPEFDSLLRIVAEKRRLGVGLVEKDYWVTHRLWSLHAQGFEVWFKGGTSLSRGLASSNGSRKTWISSSSPGASPN
jgi:predicted nucleotidyltransferase component of viral defense system